MIGVIGKVALLRRCIFCEENPRIVRGFSISFSGDLPKTKQKTSHDIEYGNAVCKSLLSIHIFRRFFT